MRLNEVYQIVESTNKRIQYQKEEVEEHKRDNLQPSEGQYPGYDNSIRISPVNTVDIIKRSVGELNEYAIWSNQEMVKMKKEIISECDRTYEKLCQLNS